VRVVRVKLHSDRLHNLYSSLMLRDLNKEGETGEGDTKRMRETIKADRILVVKTPEKRQHRIPRRS